MKYLLLFCAATNHFYIGLWCAMKSGFYATPRNDQLSGWTEKHHQSTSPSQTCSKKKSRSLYGGCYPSDPLQLSESWWNHYIWGVCSTNQWDVSKTAMPAVDTHQPKGPIASPWQYVTQCHTTNTLKVEQIGLQSCASSTIFTWPLANWQPLVQPSWQLFAGKMLPQPAGGRKYFLRVHQIPKHGFLHYMNKQTSHWQKCVDCDGSYFD